MAELKQRLITRGRETPEQIVKRLDAARWEFEQAFKYNHVVVNDNLEECVNKIKDIISARKKNNEFINTLLRENY